MKRCLYLSPCAPNVGLTAVSIAIAEKFADQGCQACLIQPFEESLGSSQILQKNSPYKHTYQPIALSTLQTLLRAEQWQTLCAQVTKQLSSEINIIVGLHPGHPGIDPCFNAHLAQALGAHVLMVAEDKPDAHTNSLIAAQAQQFIRRPPAQLEGIIMNKIGQTQTVRPYRKQKWNDVPIPLFAALPWIVYSPTIAQIAAALEEKPPLLHKNRRITHVQIAEKTPTCHRGLCLLIPYTQRASLKRLKKPFPACVIVTNSPQKPTCPAVPMPLYCVTHDTATTLQTIRDLAHKHGQRCATTAHLLKRYLPTSFPQLTPPTSLTPASFLEYLFTPPKTPPHLLLPEGDDQRIRAAARYCQEQGIAKITLFTTTKEHHPCTQCNPLQYRSDYVDALVERRKNKGITPAQARTQLNDPITLGTMMVAEGFADGMVAGATTSTAHTVRPALQIIKGKKEKALISSVFFMCLPTGVLLFADCALNTNPTAQQLANIAIDTAQTAKTFGFVPRIAMLSYSTKGSASGQDVEKVAHAVELVQQHAPSLLIDGPLQYDAAIIPKVAQEKAPNSAVAGRANILIFPDLNTGNIAYKAVQRSSGSVSVGPILQGLCKPINDLSRGATVDDIIATIAVTAHQAYDRKKQSL